jgi:hypothetical protein
MKLAFIPLFSAVEEFRVRGGEIGILPFPSIVVSRNLGKLKLFWDLSLQISCNEHPLNSFLFANKKGTCA